MKELKLAAFDMDGTLLNSEQKIDPTSLAGLEKAASKGKILCLSTGRNVGEIMQYKEELRMVDYIMCISGALIINNKTDEIIFSKELPYDVTLALFDYAKEFDVLTQIHSWTSHFQPQDLHKMAAYGMGQYEKLFEKVAIFHDNLCEDYRANPYPVYKFNYYCRDTEVRTQLEEALKWVDVTLCYAETQSLEASPMNIRKSFGLQCICDLLGISMDETMAVGDADNDLDMLKAAGLGVAMGNANANAKAAADVTVADYDHGGIRQAIEEYLLKQ